MKNSLKKFVVFYLIGMGLIIVTMGLVYNIYLGYILDIMKEVSLNPVMIHDSFALKKSLSPLVTGDILEVRLTDSHNQEIYFHDQEAHSLLSYSKTYEVTDRGRFLYSINLKISVFKFVIIILLIGFLMLFLFYPFLKFEKKEFLNKSNEAMAQLSKKLAHDIRTPISTLNLISSKITDQTIKDLQHAVVTQINLIAEDLLSESRKNFKTAPSKQHSNLNLNEKSIAMRNFEPRSYFDFFENIESEYAIKSQSLAREFKFEVDHNLRNYPDKEAKNLYSIICNLINNSVEATMTNATVVISAEFNAQALVISVEDSGHGITSDVIKKLGHEVISHGKTDLLHSGNGIALFNAQKDIINAGGTLEITSEPHIKTKIVIRLPLV